MIENSKVALFDFCETLADFQTADAYVDFVRSKTKNKRMRIMNFIQRILLKTRIITFFEHIFKGRSINKRLKLYQLRGITYKQMDLLAEQYYNERIRPHFIRPLIDQLLLLKSNDYVIGLVSGGYGIYLKFFAEEYGLDFCISSNIEVKNNICTGKMADIDCLEQNKIIYINRLFERTPEESIAYSDSYSDVPMLSWAQKGVVVSRNKHQKWIDNYKFDEIIWKI